MGSHWNKISYGAVSLDGLQWEWGPYEEVSQAPGGGDGNANIGSHSEPLRNGENAFVEDQDGHFDGRQTDLEQQRLDEEPLGLQRDGGEQVALEEVDAGLGAKDPDAQAEPERDEPRHNDQPVVNLQPLGAVAAGIAAEEDGYGGEDGEDGGDNDTGGGVHRGNLRDLLHGEGSGNSRSSSRGDEVW
jgi:hypothetical protein